MRDALRASELMELRAPVVGSVIGWALYDQRKEGVKMLGVDWKTVLAVLLILAILGFVAPKFRKQIVG